MQFISIHTKKSIRSNLQKTFCLTIFLCFIKQLTAHAQSNLLFSRNRNFQTMAERCELDSASYRSTFLISPYKPFYVTAGRWSNSPKQHPASENPQYTLPYIIGCNNYECIFQVSLKTKVAQGLFFNHGDLWVGYTRKSRWQVNVLSPFS